jgi:hypothetical protein
MLVEVVGDSKAKISRSNVDNKMIQIKSHLHRDNDPVKT